jgi:hypothetical protein
MFFVSIPAMESWTNKSNYITLFQTLFSVPLGTKCMIENTNLNWVNGWERVWDGR